MIVQRSWKKNSDGVHVRMIRNPIRRGVAAARNIGAKIAKGEVFCFLDNDTEVESEWLKHLVETLMSDTKIGASQSLLLDYKKRKIIQAAGVRLVPYTGLSIPLLRGRAIHEIKSFPTEICALGAALAVKKICIFGGWRFR
jgi:GT2 family glycosyltransferase